MNDPEFQALKRRVTRRSVLVVFVLPAFLVAAVGLALVLASRSSIDGPTLVFHCRVGEPQTPDCQDSPAPIDRWQAQACRRQVETFRVIVIVEDRHGRETARGEHDYTCR